MQLYWITHCGNLAIEAESMFVTTEHFTDKKKYLARLKKIDGLHDKAHDQVESYTYGEIEVGIITAHMRGGVCQSIEATGILSPDVLTVIDHDEEEAA